MLRVKRVVVIGLLLGLVMVVGVRAEGSGWLADDGARHNAGGGPKPEVKAALQIPERYRGKVPLPPSAEWLTPRQGMLHFVDGSGSGWIWFDAETGQVKNSREDAELAKELPKRILKPVVRGRRSRETGPETELVFRNGLEKTVRLWWLDASGTRRPYGELAAGASRVQHTFAGHHWLVTDEQGKELAVYRAVVTPSEVMIGEEGQGGEGQGDDGEREGRVGRREGPEVSPDGKYRVLIVEHQAVLEEVATKVRRVMTTSGSGADPFVSEIYWSPDSQHVIVMQRRRGEERTITLIESSPAGQVQPKSRTVPYDKPGDRLSVARPRVFAVPEGKWIEVAEELFGEPWSIDEVRWSRSGDRFTFLYNQRGHQVVRWMGVEVPTGRVEVLIEEKFESFVDYAHKLFHRYLEETEEMLWMSERDGWCHLYLFDARRGTLKHQVTRGAWVVRQVEHVDEAKREVWFAAGGIEPNQDPYFLHLCRVGFEGSGLVQVTRGDGTHKWELSPDREYVVDTYSRVDLPPRTELRRCEDGALLAELHTASAEALLQAGWRMPEAMVAKGRDGQTDIYGMIVRPSHFDSTKKYPVIEAIYAGPQSAFVPKAFGVYEEWAQLAELGFIVVKIDGMGTSHRSKAFHDVCAKNLADAGFPDRILWMQAAAKLHPEMDLERVGIYGGSAGGQNALGALLFHGDFYDVAVADCGCHDNRMDKVWWNELWMGYPIGPHYAEQSNVTQAHRLRGELMLVVGEMDDNVDPRSTLQVVHALQAADKDFELLYMTGMGHGALGSAYAERRMWEFFLRHLGSAKRAE